MKTKFLSEELSELFKKHNCKGYAWAVVQDIESGNTTVGYGAYYPAGTEAGLTKKLKIIIEDIRRR